MPFLAHPQGTVNFINSSSTFVRTNATGIGGTAGNTAATLGGFVYGVFTAPSSVTSVDASLQALLTPTWTFTGLYGTNIAASSGGRISGGSNVPTTQGWAPGTTNSFIVVGWSANVAGLNWGAVSNLLPGAQLTGGIWSGPNFASGGLSGFLGASGVSFGAAGGGPSGLPAFSLFGTAATASGTPVGGFDLFPITAGPEPGSASLLIFGFLFALSLRKRFCRA